MLSAEFAHSFWPWQDHFIISFCFQSLFCDIRQLIAYFKEIHGGTFRRVALSGLLDSYFDVKRKEEKSKEVATPTSHPIRYLFIHLPYST